MMWYLRSRFIVKVLELTMSFPTKMPDASWVSSWQMCIQDVGKLPTLLVKGVGLNSHTVQLRSGVDNHVTQEIS